MTQEYRRFDTTKLKEWKSILESVSQQINVVSSTTESEFLTLGESLMQFFDINSSNASQVNDVVEKIESGEKLNIGEISTQFDNAYTELNVVKDTFSHVTRSFSNLRGKVQKILEMKEFLSSISYSIKMLSILMKIKSSKLSEDLFSQEIKSIDALAKGISKNTQEITAYSGHILDFIDESSGCITEQIGMFDDTRFSSHKNLETSLGLLSDDTIKTKETCLKIKYLSSQLFPEINNVVSNVQFHDIARQKMEHISKALEKLSNELSNADTDEELTLRKLAIVLKLQIAHIQNIKIEAVENSGNIRGYLSEISRIAIEQGINANIIQKLAGKSSSRMDVVEGQLEQLPLLLNVIKKIKGEVVKAVEIIDSNISEIANQLKSIESFQTDLKLLTINSVILSSQLSGAGKVMSVISDNIKNLSNIVKKEVEVKHSLIVEINEISQQYREDLKENLENKTSQVESIFGSTTEAIQSLTRDDELVFELSNTTKSFENEVTQISLNLKFEEIVKANLDAAAEQLSSILHVIEEVYSPSDTISDEVKEELKLLEEQYTMQSERDIHQNSIGGEIAPQQNAGDIALFEDTAGIDLFDDSSDGDIELFTPPAPDEGGTATNALPLNPETTEQISTDDDFGDNIELF